jgi:hypothetical protein
MRERKSYKEGVRRKKENGARKNLAEGIFEKKREQR